MKNPLWLAGVLVLLLGAIAQADNLKAKDGRLDAGPSTILVLCERQITTAKTKRVVLLTDEQKTILQREASIAPSVLSLYSLNFATSWGIHSCLEYNIALWFSLRQIEVPHRFLVADDEAEKRAGELEGIDGSPFDNKVRSGLTTR